MTADVLLSRLEGVRRTGAGRWIACCPAHDDRHPSLNIREKDDGIVLVHCKAECPIEEVLAAVALTFTDLYPPRPIDHAKRERRPFNAHDILACVAFEALVVATAAGNLRQGVALTDEDHERLLLAASRLQQAEGLAYGR